MAEIERLLSEIVEMRRAMTTIAAESREQLVVLHEITLSVQQILAGNTNPTPPPTLEISADQASLLEGSTGGTTEFSFTVHREGEDISGSSAAAWAVTSSTATAADFVGGVLPSGTVIFDAGEAEDKTIIINVLADTLTEGDDAFTVTLSDPVNATIITATASATIIGDDAATPTISISANQASLTEGNSGSTSFLFTVLRAGSDLSGASSATWTVSSAAANAADFVGTVLQTGTVSFTAAQTSRTVTVTVVGDTTAESNEAFTVTLSAPSGCTITTATASSTIINDDAASPPPSGVVIAVTPTGAPTLYYQVSAATTANTLTTPSISQYDYVLPRDPSLPYLAIRYRPDTNGLRHEVVAEMPDRLAPNPGPGAYHMALLINTVVILEGDTPNHWCGARWRLETAARSVVRTVAQLQATGLVSRYIGGTSRSLPSTWRAYTPMDTAGTNPIQGATGDHDDIGPETAWVADYLKNSTGLGDHNWAEVRSNTEASASFPWFWRDTNGQIMNIDNFPTVTSVTSIGGAQPTGKPTVSKAHYPSLSYVPYFLTEDPYWLEALQAQSNSAMWVGQNIKGTGILWNDQVRGVAWTFRDLVNATHATPAGVTNGGSLLTKDYFQRKLVNNIAWLKSQTIDSVAPFAGSFRFAFNPDYYTNTAMTLPGLSSWQNDMLVHEINRAAQMGVPGALAIADWLVPNLRARTESGSGWNTAVPIFYYRTATNLRLSAATPRTVIANTWTELETANLLMNHPVDADYLHYMVTAMRWASARGHTELDAEIAHWEPSAKQALKCKSYPPLVTPTALTWPAADAAVGPLRLDVSAAGPYTPPTGATFAARPMARGSGSGNGQTFLLPLSGSFAAFTMHIGNALEIKDTHGAFGSVIIADFRYVQFSNGVKWDIPARAWV